MINLFEFILHIDQHLALFAATHGSWIYALLFMIIFCETGLVVVPFLPGDSLLFTVGALSSHAVVDPTVIVFLLVCAAISGDTLNYRIGHYAATRLLHRRQHRWLKQAYVQRAHTFYVQYGTKAIIMARFIPVLRSFIPFTAGIASMGYRRFIGLSALAALLWVGSLILLGFWFGGLPLVRSHFSVVILAIIGVSLLPAIIEFWRKLSSQSHNSAGIMR